MTCSCAPHEHARDALADVLVRHPVWRRFPQARLRALVVDEPDRLAFAAPALIKSGPLAEDDVALIARGLGVDRSDILHHAWSDNGPNWRGVMLRSAEQVLALKPDASILGQLDVGVVGPRGKVGVIGSTDAEGVAFEVRAFFPGNNGLAEDPVTGSLNAALAQWLIGAGLAPRQYVARQGTCLGRAGRVHVEQDGAAICVGGSSVTCVAFGWRTC